MRTYPRYIEEAGIHSSEDNLLDKIEHVLAETGFEILTSATIMAGFFGSISLVAAIFNHGLNQTARSLLSALAGI